jgi:hypothetical protein
MSCFNSVKLDSTVTCYSYRKNGSPVFSNKRKNEIDGDQIVELIGHVDLRKFADEG